MSYLLLKDITTKLRTVASRLINFLCFRAVFNMMNVLQNINVWRRVGAASIKIIPSLILNGDNIFIRTK